MGSLCAAKVHTVLHKRHSSKGTAPEGFQRAIGKPFGRARRRETSAFGKVIVLSENSIILFYF